MQCNNVDFLGIEFTMLSNLFAELGPYHSFFSKPVVTLFVNKTAECFKCPGNSKALPQIACKGNQELCQKPSNSILKTTCILKGNKVNIK